ncbi:MAG: ribose-phosphate pyrophosphokinase [Arenicella sp.]|jgi:ribose-phosphate pyrophosphokinase|nr:ribose-phosphate pyrophosphokinase [Arenicella sp.]
MSIDNLSVFSGNANPELAAQVVDYLKLPLGKAKVEQFSDGEIAVEVLENVRGRDVFIIQPTCAPSHKNLMELLLLIDACDRSSANRITAVVPYYGYARQDRRPRNSRVPISAKLIASMITTAGADRVLTMDLHADQIQGFFDIPTDNIYGSPVLLEDIRNLNEGNQIVVSPDVGGVVRARALAKRLGVDLAIIDKRRPKANVAKVMNIIGDVKGRSCVLIDDMVDTANTLCKAADALKEEGAVAVRAYCTHAVLSGEAVTRINASTMDEVVVTNTIPLSDAAAASDKIRQLSVAHLLGESIRRITVSDSVSSLFMEED